MRKFALIDQVVLSGSSFLLSIALARFLGPEGYGVIAITMAVVLLVSALMASLVTAPMPVLSERVSAAKRGSYFALLLRLSLYFGLLMFLLALAGFSWLFEDFSSQLMAAVFLTCYVLVEFSRRAGFAFGYPTVSVKWDFFYGAIRAVIAILAAIGFIVGPEQVVHWLAVGSFLVLVGYWVALFSPLSTDQPNAGLRKVFFRFHWRQGRWLVLGQLFYWLGSQSFVFILSAKGAVSDGGIFGALLALGGAVNLLYQGMESYAPKRLSRKGREWHGKKFPRELWEEFKLELGLVLSLCLLGYVFSDEVLSLVYGQAYVHAATALEFMMFYYALGFFQKIMFFFARAREQARVVSDSQLLGALAAFFTALVLVEDYGVVGATVALVVGQSVSIATTLFRFQGNEL